MLICCLRLDSDQFLGETVDSRQHILEQAIEIHSTNTSLTVDQFVRMNLNQQPSPSSQVPIPGMGDWTMDADIIVSGLTRREINNIERTDIGNLFQYTHHLRRLSFAAACTPKAVDYMKRHTSSIVVLGFGDGKIGKNHSVAHFSSAGIARGCRDYQWSS